MGIPGHGAPPQSAPPPHPEAPGPPPTPPGPLPHAPPSAPAPPPVPARLRSAPGLRHGREPHAPSQADLGPRLAYDASLTSRIENARRWPPPGLAARADALLGTGGELTEL